MQEKRGSQGFTLTELMVAIVIFSVVMSAIYSAYMSQQKAYQVTDNVTEIQQNLRSAMWNLERDIRMAGYNTKGVSGVFGFETMDASSIGFSFDGDSGVTGAVQANEFRRYRRNATDNTLERAIGSGLGPPVTYTGDMAIAENITNVSFQYLNASGVTATTTSAVRTVAVTLTGSLNNHTRQLTTRIKCRNMGL